MRATDDFPAGLDDWSTRDWTEYRERVEDGEGSARAIDAVNRRRQRALRGDQTEADQ
ncbi:hypothetical protein ACWD5V_02590 [Streptomyces sp. NPDC002523]